MSRPLAASPSSNAPPGARPVRCVVTRGVSDLAVHYEIRREVFVHEQGFFVGDDRDDRDDDPTTLHAVGLCGLDAAGTVRLYPLGEGLWKGDRLAVLPAYRRCNVGGPLVRFAVATAGDLGGRRMIATVQAQNVRFFVRLGWAPIGDLVPYLGHPHQGMEIPLG
ncbi:MAG: MSMEG_0567/Sll0786 family nitrogen starvation N-acetyltransferase [Egibacteraceae bacterium]